MSANSDPGLSAAVVLDGEPRWSQGFGMADLENSSPATSSTLFRLGSISKPISATAVLHGTSTAIAVVPNRKAGVVVLCNIDDVDVNQLAMQILRMVLQIPDGTL